MKNRIRTVWHFARWFPNRYDPMFGLFIQRHAEATALLCKTGVVYVHSVAANESFVDSKLDCEVENGVQVVRLYYRAASSRWSVIRKVLSIYYFYRACFQGAARLKKEIGLPEIVHVHILTRLGVMGLWYKWRYGIPYIISEHWSRYLDTGNFGGVLRKPLTRFVVQQSALVTTVTHNLSNAMQYKHNLKGSPYEVLNNVVDPVFFNVKKSSVVESKGNTFVHVSCFEDKSKNISGLLRIASALAKRNDNFRLVLVGEGIDLKRMKVYATELGLDKQLVSFTGMLTGEKLSQQMLEADALLVTSHYENLPVVILESHTLGVPVISTRVGGIAEVITQENGCLVDAGNEPAFVDALESFMNGKLAFDKDLIKKASYEKYSPECIAKRLIYFYKNALH